MQLVLRTLTLFGCRIGRERADVKSDEVSSMIVFITFCLIPSSYVDPTRYSTHIKVVVAQKG